MNTQNLRLVKAEIRQAQYRQLWKTDLSHAVASDPATCCTSVLCPWCMSWHLRRRALRFDMTRYLGCNGDWSVVGLYFACRHPRTRE